MREPFGDPPCNLGIWEVLTVIVCHSEGKQAMEFQISISVVLIYSYSSDRAVINGFLNIIHINTLY